MNRFLRLICLRRKVEVQQKQLIHRRQRGIRQAFVIRPVDKRCGVISAAVGNLHLVGAALHLEVDQTIRR